MRTGREGRDRPEDDKVNGILNWTWVHFCIFSFVWLCLVHLPCTDQMRGGKGQGGRGRRQSWGSLRRDVEGRVWWEGEGDEVWSSGKGGGEGRMEKCYDCAH